MPRSASAALLASLTLLTACGDDPQAPMQPQRISLEDARRVPSEPVLSPDTDGAAWTVTAHAILNLDETVTFR